MECTWPEGGDRGLRIGDLVSSVFEELEIGLVVWIEYRQDNPEDEIRPFLSVMWSSWGMEEGLEAWLVWPIERTMHRLWRE